MAILISQQLGTSDAALFTVNPAETATIAHGTLCNVTASAVTVYLSLVPAGGTVGDGTHRAVNAYSLAANDTLSLHDYIAGAELGPNDKIGGYASAAAAVDLVVTGTVHS